MGKMITVEEYAHQNNISVYKVEQLMFEAIKIIDGKKMIDENEIYPYTYKNNENENFNMKKMSINSFRRSSFSFHEEENKIKEKTKTRIR